MTISLAVDTNVFLLAQHYDGCLQIVELLQNRASCRLALDRKGVMKEEYKRHAASKPDSIFGKFVKEMLELQGDPHQAPYEPDCELDDTDRVYLESKGCAQPIEPQLFAVACDQEFTYLVLPAEHIYHRAPIRRGYHSRSILTDIKQHFSWRDESGAVRHRVRIVTTERETLDNFAKELRKHQKWWRDFTPPKPQPRATEVRGRSRFLLCALVQHFSLSEVENLAFCLETEADNLGGETKNDKARELVIYCERRDLLDKLELNMHEIVPRTGWAS